MKLREDVAKQDKWNLEVIFKNKRVWENTLKDIQKQFPKVLKYKGKLSKKEVVFECFDFISDIERVLGKLYVYASYSAVTDISNSEFQSMEAKIIEVFSVFSQNISFITPELTNQNEDFLKNCLDDKCAYKHSMTFRRILREKKHILTENEERLLARAGMLWGDVENIFSKLQDVDMYFKKAKDSKGKEYDVSQGTFSSLLESKDGVLRKNTYNSIYEEFGDHINTFANTLYAKVKQHHFTSDVRKYNSTLETALYSKSIPESVYKNLVNVVGDNISLLHKYIDFRKEQLSLSDLHMWDLRVSLVDEVDIKFTYDEAVELVCNALKPLGDEYIRILKKGLYGGWVDKYENKGKRSGAFSGGSYDTYPYILLNFQGTLNDVYTLAHEAGHSMHSYFARENQPDTLSEYTIFIAEIASTLNERLLTQYLLSTLDEKQKKYVISYELDAIRSTFFRQTQFAEFELLIHKSVEEGTALTVDFLNTEYEKMNRKYYGESICKDEYIKYEWARIPHFYYNYYVYQYATGIACAYNFAQTITNDGEKALDNYFSLLKSGGNDFPIIQLKKSGIDVQDKEFYNPLLKRFDELLGLLKD